MGWIKLQDKLPKEYSCVLICIKGNIEFAQYYKGEFYQPYTSYSANYIKKNITHWMLPELPEK